MMRGKITLNLSNYLCGRLVALFIFSVSLLMIPSFSQAGVVKGKVTSIRGNVMELDLGLEKGIQLGDLGKVYYNILIDGKEKSIFIAKFKITHLSENSSMAHIEEKTGDVRVGYLVDITVKEGELEVRSEPSGAKVYVDGKEAGETPVVLSNIRVGGHILRIGKEGHEPYEEQVKVGEGERKKVSFSLKKIVGALLVNTDPPGATIFIDGKPVGVSPYEGKDLPSGTHKIKVIKEGYETWEREVVVETGKEIEVFTMLREKRKEVTLPSPPVKAEPPKAKEPKVTEIPKVPQKLDLSQKSCDAPIWNVGDKWTYKKVTGEIWTNEIVDIKEDVFISKIQGTQDLSAYDKKTLNYVFKIGRDGRKVDNTNDAFKNLFNFPIFVGKRWTYSTPWRNYNILSEFEIRGVQEVETPAGKFMAYEIYYKQKVLNLSKEGWVRYWYSPQVKAWVKREVEKTPYWAQSTWLRDTELISYKLK